MIKDNDDSDLQTNSKDLDYSKPVFAERLGEGTSKRLPLDTSDEEHIGSGMIGKVFRLRITRKRGEPTFIAQKYIQGVSSEPNFLQNQLIVHQLFKKDEVLRQYVVPTFRKTKNGFVMTDLSDNNRNIVFSWNEAIDLASMNNLKLRNRDLAVRLKQVSIRDIQLQINELARRATEKNIYVCGDSIFMVVPPNKPARIYVGDLDNVSLVLDSKGEPKLSQSELETVNLKEIKYILATLDGIIGKLK